MKSKLGCSPRSTRSAAPCRGRRGHSSCPHPPKWDTPKAAPPVAARGAQRHPTTATHRSLSHRVQGSPPSLAWPGSVTHTQLQGVSYHGETRAQPTGHVQAPCHPRGQAAPARLPQESLELAPMRPRARLSSCHRQGATEGQESISHSGDLGEPKDIKLPEINHPGEVRSCILCNMVTVTVCHGKHSGTDPGLHILEQCECTTCRGYCECTAIFCQHYNCCF